MSQPAGTDAAQSLLRQLEARRRVQVLDLAIPVAARPYRIAMPADADSVLDELADAFTAAGPEQPEPHMPYWATPWASGLALAEVVLARRAALEGRRVIELGCGLGITATAALEAGANLTAVDCFGETLDYTRYNTLANTGRAPDTLVADWRLRSGRQQLVAAGPFDVVLAADVLYEAEDIEPLFALVPRLLKDAGQFWLAEPGRATSGRFVAEATQRGWPAETLIMERDWPARAGHARVSIHLYAGVTKAA